jgi:hypothetical protein
MEPKKGKKEKKKKKKGKKWRMQGLVKHVMF